MQSETDAKVAEYDVQELLDVDGALRGWVVGHLAGTLYSAHVQERGLLEAEKRGIVGKACDVRFQREGGRACRWVGEASERRLSMLVSGEPEKW